MKRIFALLFVVLFVFAGCVNKSDNVQKSNNISKDYSKEFFAMDTYMTVTAYGENGEKAVSAAEKKVKELDKKLNAEDKESEIYSLNKNGNAALSEDAACVLDSALQYWKATEGAFNPAMRPLMSLWGFTSGNYNVPLKAEINQKLALAKPEKISVNGNKAELKLDGLEVDLGGIAKGYTSSQIMKIFKESGVKSGIANLGGNVQTLGLKPDGSEWNVAIEHPDSEESYLGVLKTHDRAVITSGGYERNFEKDGKTYHHIIEPSTGYPAESGLTSVTIVAEDGTLADALSTSLFVMGAKKAEKFWRESGKDFDVILYTDDNNIIISQGIADSFSTEIKTKIIKKQG